MRHHSKPLAVAVLAAAVTLVVMTSAYAGGWDTGGVPFRTEAKTVRQFCKNLRANDRNAARAHGTKIIRFRCGRADFKSRRYTWVALFERYRGDGPPVWALYRIDFKRGRVVAWSTIL